MTGKAPLSAGQFAIRCAPGLALSVVAIVLTGWHFPASRNGKGGLAVLWALAAFLLAALPMREKRILGGFGAAAGMCGLMIGFAALPNDAASSTQDPKPSPATSVPVAPPSAAPPSPDPTTPTSPSPSPQPPASTPDLPRSAKPLADNRLVLRRRADGVWNIISVDLDGSSPTNLTKPGWQPTDPMLSRDRRSIFYLQHNDSDTHKELWVMAADGSQKTRLFSDSPVCSTLQRPAEREDGLLAIACGPPPIDKKGESVLKLMNLNGQVVRTIDRGALGDPTFTPDGQSLIYWKATQSGVDSGVLLKAAVNGPADPAPILEGAPEIDSDPAVSSQGVLAFRRFVGQRSEIATVRLDDPPPLRPQILESTKQDASDPTWSPAGTQIAFRVGPPRDSDLWVMSDRAVNPHRVYENSGHDGGATWTSR